MFKKLVIGGGSTKGLAMLGALDYIMSNNYLNQCEEFYGTSVGSIIVLLVASGYSSYDIFQRSLELETFVRLYQDPADIFQNQGLLDFQTLSNEIAPLLLEKFACIPTFKEFTEITGKRLFITGTNYTDCCCHTFSDMSSPNMSVLEAVEISCCLPFLFKQKEYNGVTWLDGGFSNNYPIDLADDGMNEVIGIANKRGVPKTTFEFAGKMLQLLYIPMLELEKIRLENASTKCTTILVNPKISSTNFSPSVQDRIKFFEEGQKIAEEILTKKFEKDWEWKDSDWEF